MPRRQLIISSARRLLRSTALGCLSGWLLLTHPVSYVFRTVDHGVAGCAAEQCNRELLALGTPCSGGPPCPPWPALAHPVPTAAWDARIRFDGWI